MKRRILALLCALMLIALPALAIPAAPEDLYVLDEANVLSDATEDYIIHNNTRLDDACGAQIVIVTVKSTGSASIDDYAYDIFNTWGIGSSKQDNGLLLVMAIADDNYYCALGTGVEKRLSGGGIKLLLDDYLEPDFARQNYDAGARKLFEAAFAEISDMYAAGLALSEYDYSAVSDEPVTGQPREGGISLTGILVIVLIIVVLFLVLRPRKARRSAHRTAPGPGPVVPPMMNNIPPVIKNVPPVVKEVVPPLIRTVVARNIFSAPRPGAGSPHPPFGNRHSASHRSFGSRPTGTFGSNRTSGSFGGSRSSGTRSFGSSRASRPSAGSRSFGGGRSRGGGAGRSR